MSPLQRGALIVFEGCDRSGKSTQCRKLVEYLNRNNKPSLLMNFPDRTTAIGKIIDQYLSKKEELPDKAVHLLFSANRWELEPKIRSILDSGTNLIVDRYSFSGVAFSAAKEGMNFKWCWQPEVGLPKPDAVVFLSISSEVAAQRGGFGSERYEESDFQKRVSKNFSLMQNETWKCINADKDIEALHSEVLSFFMDVHKKATNMPLKTFTFGNIDEDKSL